MPVALDPDLEAQFSRMGATLEAGVTAPAPTAFEIMGQNVDAFRIWLACETQWRVAAGLGGRIWLGLDYTAVDVVLRRSRLNNQDEVFADLMEMEAAALAAFAEAER